MTGQNNLLKFWLSIFSLFCFGVSIIYAAETLDLTERGPEEEELKTESVQVMIEGVEGEELKNVRAALVIPTGLVSDGKVDRLWLERFRRQIPEKVTKALEPFGYYESRVEVSREVVDEIFRIFVTVDSGKPVRVRSVKIEVQGPGANERFLMKMAATFPLNQGERLRHQKYEEAKGNLKTQAFNLGYLDAEFSTHTIHVFRVEKSADIELILNTGPRYYFGDVSMVGAPQYPEKFLKRFLEFHPGEVFSYPKIFQTQLNFNNSDRFQEVILIPEREATHELRIPIQIKLEPSKPKRLRAGIGYSTDSGLGFTATYQDLNFYRWGHELDAEINLSERHQTLVSRYVWPSSKDLNSYTSLKLAIDHEETKTYESRSISVQPEYTRGLGRGKIGSLYFQVLLEDFTVGYTEGRSRLFMPGLRFSQRRYDSLTRPQKGYHYTLEVRGTHQFLGSDTSFLQFLLNGDMIIPLPIGFSLLLRGQGAATLQSDPLQDLPATLRLFAGGDRSVRGYAYKSQGPQDASGKVVGGKHLLVGSVELERTLWKSLGVAAFYDVGNAFNTFKAFDPVHGVGLGVRLYTPVGPIRLDLARQVGVKDPDFRIHLTVGFGL